MKKKQKTIEWILRIGVFGSFLGHGVFALGIKAGWIPMFTAIGLTEANAVTLLPIIGAMDIVVAVAALLAPIRLVLIWATFWAFLTALARPVAGDPIWDFVERSANWAAPLALLYMQGLPKKFKDLFTIR